jgi:hypothetical protein
MKKVLLPLLLISSLSTNLLAAKNVSQVSHAVKKNLKTFGNKFNFQYGVQLIGPSLSSSTQDGSTYNRFKTGQDYKNDSYSGVASHQLYHSTKLGYRLNKKYSLSYTYTFQEDLNSGIKYKELDDFGSEVEKERTKGVSDNNKRFNLDVFGIVDNKSMYLNSTFFYELPSTAGSEQEDMTYGIGINSVIGFYNNNPSLAVGLSTSLKRYYFKKQEYFYKYKNNDGTYTTNKFATKYQTLKASFEPYLNYTLNDVVTLTSQVKFDWDQKGNEVDSNEVYNNNMDDVAELGAIYNIDFGIQASSKIQFVMDDPTAEKTALLLGLNITVY